MQGSLVLVLIWAVVIFASEGINEDSRQAEFRVEQKWHAYKMKFGRSYRTPNAERMRKQIFSEHVQQIDRHNSMFEQGKVSYEIGLNEHSDLNPEELKSLLGLTAPKRKTWLYSFDTNRDIDTATVYDEDIDTVTTLEEEIDFTTELNDEDEPEPYVREISQKRRTTTKPPRTTSKPQATTLKEIVTTTTTANPSLAPPTPVDWRNDPCMPPIKNQGNCGNCWAFASVAPLEFDDCKQRTLDSPVLMSEQFLTDCVYTTDGCKGGFYSTAWNTVIRKKGISAEIDYHLVSNVTGTWSSPCRNVSQMATNVKSFAANYLSETMMQDAISRKQIVPVSVYVTSGFMAYKSGIYMDATKAGCDPGTITKNVNHGVTVVGYGTDATTNTEYWVIRNSWGTSWGMNGYMHMKKGINLCNIGVYGLNVTTMAPSSLKYQATTLF